MIANGLIASLATLGHGVTALRLGISSSIVYHSLFLGAVSTAAADTLATELGLPSRSEPRLITNLSERVNRGYSGGVSPLGELASLLDTFIVGATSLTFAFDGLSVVKTLTLVLFSGFLGSTLDSVLGATIQARFTCPVCGKITEKKNHCRESATLIKGWKGVDNDVVNFISTFFGAVIALILFSIKAF